MRHVKPQLDIDPTVALAFAEDWAQRRQLETSHSIEVVIRQARIARSEDLAGLLTRWTRSLVAYLRFWCTAAFSRPAAPGRARRA